MTGFSSRRSFATAVCALAACGKGDTSSASNPTETVDAAAPSLCDTDTRGQTYTPSMVQTGKSGVFKLKLLNIIPAPAAVGENRWILELDDANGRKVPGAAMTLLASMPDHPDATPATPTITADPLGGQYTVSNLALPIPAVWVFTFGVSLAADAGGPSSDTIVFTFCVAD